MLKSIARTIVLAGSVAMATSVLADGAPRRAPAAAPAAASAFSWTGFYVGANLGAAQVSDGAMIAGPADAATNAFTLACFLANSCPDNRPGGDGTGAIGGVQLGYNIQMQGIVGGIEVDISGTTANASRSVFTQVPGFATFSGAANASLEWLSTVRGRLGFLLNPTTMAYVTAGFAFGDVQRSYGFAYQALNQISSGRVVTTDTGWTVGGGLEMALGGGLMLGAEYLYVDLDGGATFQAVGTGGCTGQCTYNVRTGDLEAHLVRLKLNYKF